ncbi:MAG: PQQ-binding-like beta-propeller repeat protein [Planctomycetaceae bacterium]
MGLHEECHRQRVIPSDSGSLPLRGGNLVILICDVGDRQYVAALNKQTGETVWEKDRPEMDAPDGDRKKSFDTPIAVTDEAGRRQVICMGSQWIVAYDPSTGDEIWKLNHGKGFSVVPRPVVGDGIVYFSTGFGKPELWGVRINGSGDVTNTHVVWKEPKSIPAMPSPLYSEGRLYVIDDKGVATCFRAADGTVLWKERVAGNTVVAIAG